MSTVLIGPEWKASIASTSVAPSLQVSDDNPLLSHMEADTHTVWQTHTMRQLPLRGSHCRRREPCPTIARKHLPQSLHCRKFINLRQYVRG